ncbi:diguanylate cyclase domain-containing protein [Reinekea blandensis]|nr:diguanylate cyclase [Reinekea blandensis]
MIHAFCRRMKVLIGCLIVCAVVPVMAQPSRTDLLNWSELEHRLYESPHQVLNLLSDKVIDDWPLRHKARYFQLLTENHLIFADYEAAQASLQQGLDLKEHADAYTLVNLLVLQAVFREVNDELAVAESGYRAALRVAEQSGEFDALLSALNALIGYLSLTRDEYELALEYVNRANDISDSVTRRFLVGDLYNHFGNILSYMGDTDGALRQYAVAESIYTTENNNVSLSSMLYNRAAVLEEAGEFIAALRTYELFMERAERWGDPTAVFFGNMGIANIYSLTGRYVQAYEALEEARSGLSVILDAAYRFDFWLTSAYVAADVDDFTLAEEALSRLDVLQQRLGGPEPSQTQAAVMDASKYIAYAKGDMEQAYELSEQLRQVEAELMAQEQQSLITQIRIDSENAMYQTQTERLASENREQQETIAAQNRIQQLLLIVIAVLMLSLIAVSLSLHRKMRQMRILQQYSAISESVKSAGFKMMESLAGLMFDQSERHRSPLSVVVFDVHDLSDVREQFGQPAVDAVHRWLQDIVKAELGDEDRCGQISFERFMLLLPGADLRAAKRLAQTVIDRIKAQSIPEWPQLHPSVSAGVSERSRHDRSSSVLTYRATTAVDLARAGGAAQVKTLTV